MRFKTAIGLYAFDNEHRFLRKAPLNSWKSSDCFCLCTSYTKLTFKLYVNVPLTNVLSIRKVADWGRTDSWTIKLQAFTDFTYIFGCFRNITPGTSC